MGKNMGPRFRGDDGGCTSSGFHMPATDDLRSRPLFCYKSKTKYEQKRQKAVAQNL